LERHQHYGQETDAEKRRDQKHMAIEPGIWEEANQSPDT
jgi:hypothetical protein